jgi:hypothetical protein
MRITEDRATITKRSRWKGEHPGCEPGEQKAHEQQHTDADPLPDRNAEHPARRKQRRESFAKRTEAVTLVELGDRGHRNVRELPDEDAILSRYALEQDVDLPFGRLDAPEVIAIGRHAVVSVPLGVDAHGRVVDPEGAVQHDLELARQLWTLARIEASRQVAQIEILGGSLPIAGVRRLQVASEARAGNAAVEGVRRPRWCLDLGG